MSPYDMDIFAVEVKEVIEEVAQLLISKNRQYGNSALDPVRIFSRAYPDEQIKVRIDDKLSRVARGDVDEDEDVVLDLLGYFILLRIAKKHKQQVAAGERELSTTSIGAVFSKDND